MRNQYTYTYIIFIYMVEIHQFYILVYSLTYLSVLKKCTILRLLYNGKHSHGFMSINYFHTVYYKRNTFIFYENVLFSIHFK